MRRSGTSCPLAMRAGDGLILYPGPTGTCPSSGVIRLDNDRMIDFVRKEGGKYGIQRQFFRLHPQRALCAAGGLDTDKKCIRKYQHHHGESLSGQ